VTSSTSVESVVGVSEVFFRAGRWWNDALCGGLLDSDVNTIEGWRVLGALRRGDGYTMSEISAAMSIPPPTLTRIVDKLVDGGFVLRRVDATDRRRVLIYLSARGKTKVRKLAKQEGLIKATLSEELGEDAAIQLIRTLARIGDLSP
jgi:MarR family transcriptional regulator, organic hydroperoxide resistance regulator